MRSPRHSVQSSPPLVCAGPGVLAADRWLPAGQRQAASGGAGRGAAVLHASYDSDVMSKGCQAQQQLAGKAFGWMTCIVCHLAGWQPESAELPPEACAASEGRLRRLRGRRPDQVRPKLTCCSLTLSGQLQHEPFHAHPHRRCADSLNSVYSATESSITIGLRGALGMEISHQTVNVDLHSG